MTRPIRPEIQGLRALAVALVVVYHLRPGAVPGGFVGVDVFFVISGYLITGQLLAMAARPEGLSLAHFWAGRIRRLLPAASVVLAASLLGMLVVVPPALWQRTVLEVGASALYAQNWALAAASVDYLGGDATPTLVQHFWSLSVEEQFYLVWPLLILAAIAIRWPRAIVGMLVLVLLASLTYSVALADSPRAYFDTGTRAWEFAAGGLLAAMPGVAAWFGSRPIVAGIASWTGVTAVGLAALAFNGATPFPGIAAALPVAGTALTIAAGAAPWSVAGVARTRAVRFVGDSSYSMYLWHWPLIVLLGYLAGDDPGIGLSLAIVALALVLAGLTKRFVEDPPRRAAALSRGPSLTYAAALAVVALLVTVSGVTWGVVRDTTAASARAAVEQFESDPCFGAGAMRNPDSCTDRFGAAGVDTAFAAQDRGVLAERCNARGAELRECVFGEREHPTLTVAVVGNSHAAALVPGLVAYGESLGWQIVLMRKTDCLGVSTLELKQPAGPDCAEWTAAVRERLLGDGIDVAVFGAHRNAMHYLADPVTPESDLARLQPHIEDGFAALVAAGKGVLVVGDTPGTEPVPAPECVYLHRAEPDPCATPFSEGLEDRNIESRAARATPGVTYLSLLPSVCDTVCHAVIGGVVVYFDDHHLSASFSRSLAPQLGQAVRAALMGARP